MHHVAGINRVPVYHSYLVYSCILQRDSCGTVSMCCGAPKLCISKNKKDAPCTCLVINNMSIFQYIMDHVLK